jgi:hypothetical protein
MIGSEYPGGAKQSCQAIKNYCTSGACCDLKLQRFSAKDKVCGKKDAKSCTSTGLLMSQSGIAVCSGKSNECPKVVLGKPGTEKCGDGKVCKEGKEKGTAACVSAGCADLNCGLNETCKEGKTGAQCICDAGYEKGTKGTCIDINECTASKTPCTGANTVCNNTAGSYTCDCKSGYKKNSKGFCTNVNECSGVNVCNKYSNCKDTVGSYICACKEGFSAAGQSSYTPGSKTVCTAIKNYCTAGTCGEVKTKTFKSKDI